MSGIGLSREQVDRAFPYHVAFGPDGRVLQVGAVLQRLCPALVGGAIADTFEIVRPQPMPFDFHQIQHHPRTVFVLQVRQVPVGHTALKLKGQMMFLDDGPVMLFLGSPWINELAELGQLGLQLGDFAVHDQVVDCLFLIQSHQTALADVRRLASQQSVKLAQQQQALLEAERLARERLEKELDLARQIQVSILPRRLIAEGVELAACMTTATEVGGDYYDVLPIDGGCWIGIGDVSGHGVTSGLIMLMVQSAVAGLVARDPDASPAEAVTIVNRVLFENIRHRLLKDDFVTFSLLRVTDRRIVFAGAHEHFLVVREGVQPVESIATPGTWLGVMPDIGKFTTETTVDLRPNDLVVLYTDGITEARNARGEQYGFDRLCALVGSLRKDPIEQIRDNVLADVSRWAPHREDDATLVLLRQMN
jgi:serine phosphatase RsbU (regulator of sigma subunit)